MSIANQKIETKKTQISHQPAISIIVPIYNVAQYLRNTLQSVLQQSFTDWELLLVDDASTDGSREIAQSFAKQDTRIKLFLLSKNTPGGAGIPSNIGLKHAKGKYITFLDSDDIYLPNFLGTLYQHSEIFEEVDIAMIRYQIYYLNKGKKQHCYPDDWAWNHLLRLQLGSRQDRRKVHSVTMNHIRSCIRYRSSGTDNRAWSKIQAFYIFFGLSPVPWRKMYRREFLLQNGIQYPEKTDEQGNGHYFEDIPLHWYACSQAHSLLFCDTLGYLHSMGRAGQTIASGVDKMFSATLFQFEQLLDYLLQTLDSTDSSAGKPNNSLGTGGEFYLLLWLKSLLHTFCYHLRPRTLQQAKLFYLDLENMLYRRILHCQRLTKILKPLHRIRFSDGFYLRLDFMEIIIWQLLTIRISKNLPKKVRENCSKPIIVYLALLRFPLIYYGHALRDRIRYFLSEKLS